jgi:hypothetical protein
VQILSTFKFLYSLHHHLHSLSFPLKKLKLSSLDTNSPSPNSSAWESPFLDGSLLEQVHLRPGFSHWFRHRGCESLEVGLEIWITQTSQIDGRDKDKKKSTPNDVKAYGNLLITACECEVTRRYLPCYHPWGSSRVSSGAGRFAPVCWGST